MKFTVEIKQPPRKRVKNPAYRTPMQIVIDEVLAKYNMEWNEVFNDRRFRAPSLIRNEVWWTLKQLGLTYNQIGRICRPEEPYDHSTILHGVRLHQRLLDGKDDSTTKSPDSSNNS